MKLKISKRDILFFLIGIVTMITGINNLSKVRIGNLWWSSSPPICINVGFFADALNDEARHPEPAEGSHEVH